jgi:hypothetical protein
VRRYSIGFRATQKRSTHLHLEYTKRCTRRTEMTYRADVVTDGNQLHSMTCILIESSPGAHSCVWGCSERKEPCNSKSSSRCVEYPSRQDLRRHLQAHHSYGDDSPLLSPVGRLARIPEGNDICMLICGIAAAACAINSSLLCLPKNLGSSSRRRSEAGSVFFVSRTSNMFCFNHDADTRSNMESLGENGIRNPRAAELLALGLTVGELFDSNGKSRMARDGSQQCQAPSTLPGPNFEMRSGRHRHRPSDSCSICNLGCDNLILGNDRHEYRGLGCAPVSSLSLGSVLTEDSRLSHAKQLLLSITRRVPKAAYHIGSSTDIEGIRCRHLWSSDAQGIWRSFVLGSRSWETLAQAFAVLAGAIDREKLPKWWKSEGTGWSQVQAVLAIGSIAELLHQLYVFDAAVSEFGSFAISDSTNIPSSPKLPSEFNGLPYDEIVAQIFSFMKSSKLEKFDGENVVYCCMCGDGGEVLCCDICSNVQHRTCVIPKLSKDPDDFVCYCCIVDVGGLFLGNSE